MEGTRDTARGALAVRQALMRNPEHITRQRPGDEREARLDAAIDDALAAPLGAQRGDGHWVFGVGGGLAVSSG